MYYIEDTRQYTIYRITQKYIYLLYINGFLALLIYNGKTLSISQHFKFYAIFFRFSYNFPFYFHEINFHLICNIHIYEAQ